MATKMWKIKLACGHWSIDLTPAQREAARSVGFAACGSETKCGGVHAVTDVERHGGKSATKTARWLASKPTFEVTAFPGGLICRDIGKDRVEWWCRWCDGHKVHHELKGRCRKDVMAAEWRIHADTERHIANRRTRELVDDVTRAL